MDEEEQGEHDSENVERRDGTDPGDRKEAAPSSPHVEGVDHAAFYEIKLNQKVFLRNEALEFDKLAEAALKAGARKFLVNFHHCEYISSEGLGVVADFWRKCSEGEDLRMAALFSNSMDNSLLNFFEIIGLARVMASHIFTDYAKAKSFLS